MQLLITSSNPTTFWQLQGSTASQLKLTDLGYYCLGSLGPDIENTLPEDLAEPILVRLFLVYLRKRDFAQALELATVNKYFMKRIYKIIFQKEDLPVKEMYKRLARTFLFCDAVDEYLVSERSISTNYCLRINRPGTTYRPVLPWQFGKYAVKEPMQSGFFRGPEPLKTYNVGPLVGDIVWINGETHRGITKAKEFYHPVINIVLCDGADTLLTSAEDLESCRYMKWATKLLYFIYGPSAIINYMVKEDDNPFVVSTESFISMF